VARRAAERPIDGSYNFATRFLRHVSSAEFRRHPRVMFSANSRTHGRQHPVSDVLAFRIVEAATGQLRSVVRRTASRLNYSVTWRNPLLSLKEEGVSESRGYTALMSLEIKEATIYCGRTACSHFNRSSAIVSLHPASTTDLKFPSPHRLACALQVD